MDSNSTTEVTPQPKRKGRIRRFLLRSLMVLVAALVVAHFAWKYSGSGQWVKEGERKGVTVYGMKNPGSVTKKYKAVWKMRGKLSRFVMWASDVKPTTRHSMRREIGLYDHRVLETHADLRATWSAWKVPFGPYLSPREFVARAQFSQDPVTKKVSYTVTGEPTRLPPDECCVRIPLMINVWTLTPLKTGEIEVEWFVDMELGGAMPYFAQNAFMPKGMYGFASRVQMFTEQEKYKNAQYYWIQEPDAPTSLTQSAVPAKNPS
ncbi:MAG TPA: hypothetical protein VF432_32220 [Thermoanaerobaculia bacterium]